MSTTTTLQQTPAQAAGQLRPNAWQRALSKVAPATALKSYRAARQFAYEAALSTRYRNTADRSDSPNSFRMERDRIAVMDQVRDLEENDGLVRSILNKLSLYAFGRLRRQCRTGNRELDKEIEWRFSLWAKRAGMLNGASLRQITMLAHRCAVRDGDAFVRFHDVRTEEGQRALALEVIEADCVGGRDNVTRPDYVGGVNLSRGEVISYDLYERTISGAYRKIGTELKRNVAHILDTYRAGQYRGISRFGPVCNDARDLKEIKEACKIGVKVENMGAGFIIGGAGEFQNDINDLITEQRSSDGTQKQVERIEAGVVRYLADGTSFQQVKSDRPSGNFQTYLDTIVRNIGVALNLPMGFLYSLAGLSGPAARMDAQQAARAVEEWQTLLRECFLDQCFVRWLKMELALNGLQLPAGVTEEDAMNGVWMFSPSLTIDAGRDSASAQAEVRMGMRSLQDWYAEDAKDAEEELDVIADEARSIADRAQLVSEATGVPVARALDLIQMRSGYNPDITTAQPDMPSVQPLISTIGIGGAQVVGETLRLISEGLLPRAEAIAYLSSLTGVSPDEVSKWIPADAPTAKPVPTVEAPAPSVGMAALVRKAQRVIQLETGDVSALEEKSYTPTDEMAENARRALDVREQKPESQRGMTPVGIARARDLMNKRPLSIETVARMKAFFDRHQGNKSGETWDDQGKGWQAWMGWGGDEGRAWAERIMEEIADE